MNWRHILSLLAPKPIKTQYPTPHNTVRLTKVSPDVMQKASLPVRVALSKSNTNSGGKQMPFQERRERLALRRVREGIRLRGPQVPRTARRHEDPRQRGDARSVSPRQEVHTNGSRFGRGKRNSRTKSHVYLFKGMFSFSDGSFTKTRLHP